MYTHLELFVYQFLMRTVWVPSVCLSFLHIATSLAWRISELFIPWYLAFFVLYVGLETSNNREANSCGHSGFTGSAKSCWSCTDRRVSPLHSGMLLLSNFLFPHSSANLEGRLCCFFNECKASIMQYTSCKLWRLHSHIFWGDGILLGRPVKSHLASLILAVAISIRTHPEWLQL